jgi:hypothetical protein
MELAAARMVGSARASQRESAAAQAATVALRLVTAALAVRMRLESAMAVRPQSQLTGTAPRTGRPVKARPTGTAAALPITAASRLLIAALGGK